MFAELFAVHNGAQTPANQALNLLRAPRLFAAGSFTVGAGTGRARQQPIFSRHPAFAFAAKEIRHADRHTGGTEHMRITRTHENAAFSIFGEAPSDFNRAERINCTTIGARNESFFGCSHHLFKHKCI